MDASTKTYTANERRIQEMEHELFPDKPRSYYRHTACRACGPGPLGRHEIPSMYDHVFYGEITFNDGYGPLIDSGRVSKPSEADTVTSEIEGGDGMHTVMLDIDMPARLIPSSTPDHSHLYIDHQMTWRQYKKLLRALCRAGVIEKGFYKASVRRKASHLRVPWKDKGL